MDCRKCKKSIPDDAIYCPYCAAKQQRAQSRRRRGNGTGSAYKRGATWTAVAILGWRKENGKAIPIKATKGGFSSKTAALEYVPRLRETISPKHASTFADYWALYRDNALTKLSASKQTAYKIAYQKLEDRKWPYRAVAQATTKDIQDIINEAGTSFYTARDIKSILSHIYKLALADQIVNVNLTDVVTLPTLNEAEPTPFTEAELKQLWSEYAQGEPFIGYMLLMIYSGMMPGELLKLEKHMIKWDKQQIIGCGLKTKKRKEIPLVVADFILPILQTLCEQSPQEKLVCMGKNQFYDAFKAQIERMGMNPAITPYSCRHTQGTALALGNIAPSVIQKAMRHSKFATTQRYIHPDTKDVLAAVNQLSPSPKNKAPDGA